jgi:cytochrome c-type biogenesis protein CcmH
MLYEFESSQQEKRFYLLISEIRCPKCTSGSIASSDAPVSRDLKNKVYELVLSGATDQEIKFYVSDRFGDFSDYRPLHGGSKLFLVVQPLCCFYLTYNNFFY